MKWTRLYQHVKRHGGDYVGDLVHLVRRPDAMIYAARGVMSPLDTLRADSPIIMMETMSRAISEYVDGEGGEVGMCLVEVERIDSPATREVMYGVTVTPVEEYRAVDSPTPSPVVRPAWEHDPIHPVPLTTWED